jgi:hypothetical protein
MRRLLLILLLALAPAASPPVVLAATPTSYCYEHELDDGRPRSACIGLPRYTADVCDTIQRFALSANLPPDYFARLIWQESRFNANAISRTGAEGIAQFMPSTGRLQGLVNPYNPAEALWRSANYLSDLRDRFGNLGLAAAAYNGGENRLRRFVAGTGYLPAETLDYVQIITGQPVTDWLIAEGPDPDYALQKEKPFRDACIELAENSRIDDFTPPTSILQPWGIQVAEFFSSATARRAFTRIQGRYGAVLGDEELMLVARRNPNFGLRLRYIAQVGRGTRAEAEELCESLRKVGGNCIVVRNN